MSARAGRLRAATGTLAGAAAMITLVTTASRLVGFARSLVQSFAVGTEGVGSAFTAANLLPNVLFEVAAGGALAGSVVPLLAGPIARRAGGEVSRIASALLGWTLVVLVPLGALLALLAQPIASLLMLPKHPELVDVTATFVRVFALQVPLYGLAVVLGSILQAHKRFFWQAFSPLLSSLAVIVVFLVFAGLAGGDQKDVAALSGQAIAWLGWGTTAGVAVLALPLVLPVHRLGVRLRPTLRFPGGEAVRARNLAFAGVGALVAQQLSVLAIMGAAYRFGPEQTFPTYWYAQQVYLLPYAVLAFPLATSTFPRLAEHVAHARHDAYRRLLATTTRTLLVVAGLGVAALIAASAAVEAVFARIATGSVDGLGGAVAAMAMGIVGFSLILHLSRALYTIDRQRIAVVVTARAGSSSRRPPSAPRPHGRPRPGRGAPAARPRDRGRDVGRGRGAAPRDAAPRRPGRDARRPAHARRRRGRRGAGRARGLGAVERPAARRRGLAARRRRRRPRGPGRGHGRGRRLARRRPRGPPGRPAARDAEHRRPGAAVIVPGHVAGRAPDSG